MTCLLIVDDDEFDRRMIMDALRKADGTLTMHEVAHGPLAHAALKQLAPELTLLDVRMPDMDGLEVLAAIRKDQDLCALRVVMLSGSDDPQDIERASALGAIDYRVKPSSRRGYEMLAEDICKRWLN